MNGLDIALLVVLIFFFLRGIFRGFVKEIVGVLALVVGFVIASSYYAALGDALKPLIQQLDYRNTIGFEILFLVAFFLDQPSGAPDRQIDFHRHSRLDQRIDRRCRRVQGNYPGRA